MRRAFFVPRDPAVDVGCGTGRWTRELAACGLATPGVDVAPIMVARAQELAPALSFDVASATELPFADGSQQLVACITVLHHLTLQDQERAVGEIARILRPGGYCLVMVLLNVLPAGSWCYPRDRVAWHRLFERHGLLQVESTGEEYPTPVIVLHWAAAAARALIRGRSGPEDPGVGTGGGPIAALYGLLHRVAVVVSQPLEVAASRLWPGGPSTGMAALYVRVEHAVASHSIVELDASVKQ